MKSDLKKAYWDTDQGSFLTILPEYILMEKVRFAPNYAVNCLKKELSLGIHSCRSCGYSTERYMTVAQVRK